MNSDSPYKPPSSDISTCPVTKEEVENGRLVAEKVYKLQVLGMVLIIPFLIASILNYRYYSSVRTSWVETHFKWQLKTFWLALLWGVIATILALSPIGVIYAILLLVVVYIWITDRIIRGRNLLLKSKHILAK